MQQKWGDTVTENWLLPWCNRSGGCPLRTDCLLLGRKWGLPTENWVSDFLRARELPFYTPEGGPVWLPYLQLFVLNCVTHPLSSHCSSAEAVDVTRYLDESFLISYCLFPEAVVAYPSSTESCSPFYCSFPEAVVTWPSRTESCLYLHCAESHGSQGCSTWTMRACTALLL